MKHLFILSLLTQTLITQNALSWGERGHLIVGAMASKLAGEIAAQSKETQKSLEVFFKDRTHIFGHLANVPDTSWKDAHSKPIIHRINSPCHYFGPERLLGAPPAYSGKEFLKYVEKIKSIEPDYQKLKEQYFGKPSPLTINFKEGRKTPKQDSSKNYEFYSFLGVTPYRSQDLFNAIVASLKCAKSKEGNSELKDLKKGRGAYPAIEAGFQVPFTEPSKNELEKVAEFLKSPTGNYQCDSKTSRLSDIHAAVVLMGHLAHFIGDQSQPYHPTADYDGWLTGNGGVHGYFEGEIVQAQNEDLSNEVFKKAAQPKFQESFWQSLGPKLSEPHGVARLLIWFGADSIKYKNTVRDLDAKYALIEKSDSLDLGDHAFLYPKENLKKAKRKNPWDPKVYQSFKPLIIEQLAKSVVVLAKTWLSAWEIAGKPSFDEIDSIALAYPLDPPFLWPSFEADLLPKE